MKKYISIIILPLLLAGCLEYSSGERVGTITKLSRKGLVCKTWEGQMLMGGLRKQNNHSSDGKSSVDTMVANTFEFTVENISLIPKIQAALASGARITLNYREELVTFCRSDSNGYFVTDVK